MSWQRNAASAGAGIAPYIGGALLLWAIADEQLRLSAPRTSTTLFLGLVALGIAVAFSGPFVASLLNPMNLGRAAYFGLAVHALGLILPSFVATLEENPGQPWWFVFLRFYLLTGALTVPLALAGGVTGALIRERHRSFQAPGIPKPHGKN